MKKERSAAQKAADKRYAEKIAKQGKAAIFATTLAAEEVAAMSALIKENKMTKAAFLRRAFAALKEGRL
jgi:hypothetical protein